MADIQGTAAGETLVGTSGNDNIVGGGGIDRIEAGRGNDVLTGSVDAASALYGEAGNDLLYGGDKADGLYGGAGDDVVRGGDGNDFFFSDEGGSDSLYGEGGDDTFDVSRFQSFGAIQAFGGAGSDYFDVDVRTGSTIAIDAGEGDDFVELWSWDAAATVTLGAGRDLLRLKTAGTFNGTSGTGPAVTDFQTGPGGDVFDVTDALVTYTTWDGASNPFTSGFMRLTQSGADAILEIQSGGSFTRAMVFRNASAASFTAENFAGISPTAAVSAPVVATGTDSVDVLGGGSGDDILSGGAGRDMILGGFGGDTLNGGGDADRIDGGAGNDLIDGGEGNDSIYGGFGDDVVHGGGGADFISENHTGTDILWGDEGNDQLWVQRKAADVGGSVTLNGGEGDDALYVNTYNADPVFADGGIGTDRAVVYNLLGSVTFTLGDGADVVDLTPWLKSAASAATIAVTDFAAGADGDRLDWSRFVSRNATGLAADANPFGTGHARLVQAGSDVLLQFDRDGGANGYVTLITFQNSLASAFTSFNLGGFSPDASIPSPLTITGTDAGETLVGDGGADSILGGDGADTIYGLTGADDLDGGLGNDLIRGGGGNDVIDGGEGDDTLYGDQGTNALIGGNGSDYLVDNQLGGNGTLSGGGGADTIIVERFSGADSLTADGGDGSDWIWVNMHVGSLALDAGAGDDTVYFTANGSTTLTLGAGSDVIDFYDLASATGTITITDFQTGDGGDRFDWDHWLATELTSFSSAFAPDPNPFATGHLRLVQSGANSILQLDRNGGGDAFANWITFQNIDVRALTAWNFDSYVSPFATTVGTAADETFQGTSINDNFDGGGGNDTFLIGYGGSDSAVGAGGDDIFFVALTTAAASHRVTGAGGDDLLQIQGHGAQSITIGASAASGQLIQASGIGTIQLLSGSDASRNWSAGAAPLYTVTLQDGATAAGGALIVDGSGLTAGEALKFSTDESDATLLIVGGAGSDVLRGGALGDVLLGGGGSDQLDGGAGGDVMVGGDAHDYYYVDDAADSISEEVNAGIDTIMTALASYSILDLANVENLFATSNAAHDFRGSADNNRVMGADGNDILRMQDGGRDTASGGGGNDFFLFGATFDSSDTIDGGPGTDQIAIQGNYNLTFGSVIGVESLIPLPGNDVRFGDSGANSYDYVLTTVDSNVAAGQRLTVDANRLRAGEDFTFNGSAETNGNFFLIGGNGVDTLTGGAQSDTFLFGENGQFGAGDTVNGLGGANDQLGLRGDYVITFGTDQLIGIESISLVSSQDTRFGPRGSVFSYNLTMNDGNVAAGQMMTVDAAPLRGGETLTFNGVAELDGAFRVAGGAGNDTVTGSQGGDILIGRGGADTMTGGGGNDQFRYNETGDSTSVGRDGIQDFTLGDLIDLSRVDADSNSVGNQAFAFIGGDAFHGIAGELRATTNGGNIWLVEADTDGNHVADMEFWVVTPDSNPIIGGDFIL